MIIDDLSHWHVHAPDASDVRAAIDIHRRTGASFWDAMIVRSAKELGCQALYSEDLNPGQAYERPPPRPAGSCRSPARRLSAPSGLTPARRGGLPGQPVQLARPPDEAGV